MVVKQRSYVKNYCERDQAVRGTQNYKSKGDQLSYGVLVMNCGCVNYMTFSHEWMWKVLRIQSFGKVKLCFVCEHKHAFNC